MRDLFLNALACKNNASRPPVWLMRQAGRYLPEYQEIRRRTPLEDLFFSKEKIITITKQPLKRFDLDAAVIFSDILLPTEGLGISWTYPEGIGPTPSFSISSPEDLKKMQKRDIRSIFSFLGDAIADLSSSLDVPVIGLAGGPFTVASYLIEGKPSAGLHKTKRFSYLYPEAFHQLLEAISSVMIDFLNLQIEAGAKAVQIFDSWAGLLAPHDFDAYSLKYFQKIRSHIPRNIPCIYFSRGSGAYASRIKSISPDGVSVDWTADISSVREKLPLPIVLQGNLDPSYLFGPEAFVREKTEEILSSMQNDPGFIFNLGHGILPKTPPENVAALVETVKGLVLV